MRSAYPPYAARSLCDLNPYWGCGTLSAAGTASISS